MPGFGIGLGLDLGGRAGGAGALTERWWRARSLPEG